MVLKTWPNYFVFLNLSFPICEMGKESQVFRANVKVSVMWTPYRGKLGGLLGQCLAYVIF